MEYFLTQNRMEQLVPMSGNADVNDWIMNIRNAADMWVRNILGTYFYKDLLTKYNNQTMSPNELLLLDEIQPAIAWKALSESVKTLSFQLKNKGVQTQFGDFMNSAEYKSVMYMVHDYSDKADFYLNRLSNFLTENRALYPVFLSAENKDSTAKHNCGGSNNFQQNIIFI
jgi:hypothetical protein